MINLSQLEAKIKSSAPTRARLNPAHPLAVNEAYKQLKSLGWICLDSEVHPADRVPVFRLGSASIRRDKTTPGGWIIAVSDSEFRSSGSVSEITTSVNELAAPVDETAQATSEIEPTPAPLSPAALEAQGLISEYPQLAERIAKALALVEAGVTKFPQYQTEWQNLTRDGNWICNCPDAQHRQPRAKFGIACKHTLAGEIAARVKRSAWQTANRKLADNLVHAALRQAQDAAARNDYANPADYKPAADPLNRQAQRPVYQFGRHVVR